MKYTAKEILTLAGVEKPEEIVGKMRVRIGGISVRKLDHIINVKSGTLEVVVGVEKADVEIPERAEHSDEVRASIKAKGVAASEAFAASQVAKGRLEEETKEEETE